MPRTNSHINFVAIKEIADRAIRRTAVFVALGLNSAKRCSEYDLELEDVRHLALLPEDPSEEVASICTEEFSTWIITCGLRELLETFGTFLDEIDWACNEMRLHYSGDAEKTRPISLEGFQYKGLAEKLGMLDEMYSVKSDRREMLISINRVRQLQNTVVPSGYRSNAYGDHKQYRPARFPSLLTSDIRIACPVAILSTPCDEGTNPGHRYFRPIGHPPVSLCRNRQPTGMRGVPISSWDRLPSQRSDEEPVLANQGSMQEP